MAMPEYYLRRTCTGCDCVYQHAPALGEGVDNDGERVFLIACSWNCLSHLIEERELDKSDPPNARFFVS